MLRTKSTIYFTGQVNFKLQILPKACLRQKLQNLLNKRNIDILVIVICDLFVFCILIFGAFN